MANLGCRSGLHNKTGPLLLKEMRVTVRFRFSSNAPDRVCVAGSIENFFGGVSCMTNWAREHMTKGIIIAGLAIINIPQLRVNQIKITLEWKQKRDPKVRNIASWRTFGTPMAMNDNCMPKIIIKLTCLINLVEIKCCLTVHGRTRTSSDIHRL